MKTLAAAAALVALLFLTKCAAPCDPTSDRWGCTYDDFE